MMSSSRRWLLCLLATLLSACSWTSMSMPEASSYGYAPDRVIVVGKMELLPPVDIENEQRTHWNAPGDEAILNRVFMFTSAEPTPIDTDDVGMGDFKNSMAALWDVTFFLESTRERTYLRGGMMVLDSQSSDRVWFPGGYYYDAPKEASAIYIGTLRYTRDDFYNTKKLELIDEYNSASKQFKAKFGATAQLTKALLKKAKK